MRLLYRKLTNCCIQCGQKLDSSQSSTEQILRINKRAGNLTKSLGRIPIIQNCDRCHRIIFEGEPGFVQRYLLTDFA